MAGVWKCRCFLAGSECCAVRTLTRSNSLDGRSGEYSVVEGYEVVCLSALCVYTVLVFLSLLRAIGVIDARSVVRHMYGDNLLTQHKKNMLVICKTRFSAMK